MNEQQRATRIIEDLRHGIPPQTGVQEYSVGNENLLAGVEKYLLSNISNQGFIRFVSGSWGSGKTHLFRQLRELAFKQECLVSNIELNVNSAALNKFETIFKTIVQQIASPSIDGGNGSSEAGSFGFVIQEALAYLVLNKRTLINKFTHEEYNHAVRQLDKNHLINFDFRTMVKKYWETFLPDAPDSVEETRGMILQWFSCEGDKKIFKDKFDVSTIIKKENAQTMLKSLVKFIQLAGYNGILILFDEAEQAYSVMKIAALHDAHNNLLSLINNVGDLQGIIMIYATTPDFYTDPRHGIIIYGALASRIGKLNEGEPHALKVVWNLDEIYTNLIDYQNVAIKIRKLYILAYPQAEGIIPNEEEVNNEVDNIHQMHPKLAAVRFWRKLVTYIVSYFDDYQEGKFESTEKLYNEVMARLSEE